MFRRLVLLSLGFPDKYETRPILYERILSEKTKKKE